MATRLFRRPNGRDVFASVVADDNRGAETDFSTTRIDELEETRPHEDDPEIDVKDTDESDTDSEEATERAAGGAAAPPSRAKRWLRRILLGLTGVVLVTAVAATGYLGWQLKQRNDSTAAGRTALAAAERYAVVMTSMDSSKIDDNVAQVLDGATGEFKDVYSQAANQLRQLLIDNKAVSKGVVIDSAIKSATKTRVEVLIFIDQSISNVVNPEPRIDRSRVAITMNLVDNRWLASKVDIK
jgi:Mce-associated membrane protein